MASDIFTTVWTLPLAMQKVTDSRFYLSASSIDNPSPWTGQRTPYGPFVQMWMAELTMPPQPEKRDDVCGFASWREWQGFITRLRGTSGLIRLPDSYRRRPMYDLENDPTLTDWSDGSKWSDGAQWSEGALPPFVTLDEAAKAEADTVVLRGLPASTGQVLSPGDLFEMRPNGIPTNWSNLYEVVHCSRSNSSGKARIYFQPGLRQGFAMGDMALLRNATGVFRLADKDQGIVTRTPDRLGRLGLKLIEEMINA